MFKYIYKWSVYYYYWKNTCCTSEDAKPRLHAGHFRCRVVIRASTHCRQNAVYGAKDQWCKTNLSDSLCIHLVMTVFRICILHVEHFRTLCNGKKIMSDATTRRKKGASSPCIYRSHSAAPPPSASSCQLSTAYTSTPGAPPPSSAAEPPLPSVWAQPPSHP